MQLLVNGEARELPPGSTIDHLIAALSLAGRRLAVERNGEIVPRSRYSATALQDGDRLEIVQAIGGG